MFFFNLRKESFHVKAPGNMSQHLSNTIVNRQRNWDKGIFQVWLELGLKPRSPKHLLPSFRIHIRQAKLHTLPAIV